MNGDRDEEYVLFSRSGFDSKLNTLDENWYLYDQDRLEADFDDTPS